MERSTSLRKACNTTRRRKRKSWQSLKVTLHWMITVSLSAIRWRLVSRLTSLLSLLLRLTWWTWLRSRSLLSQLHWSRSWNMMTLTVRWWDLTWCVRRFLCCVRTLRSLVPVSRRRLLVTLVLRLWLSVRARLCSLMLLVSRLNMTARRTRLRHIISRNGVRPTKVRQSIWNRPVIADNVWKPAISLPRVTQPRKASLLWDVTWRWLTCLGRVITMRMLSCWTSVWFARTSLRLFTLTSISLRYVRQSVVWRNWLPISLTSAKRLPRIWMREVLFVLVLVSSRVISWSVRSLRKVSLIHLRRKNCCVLSLVIRRVMWRMLP